MSDTSGSHAAAGTPKEPPHESSTDMPYFGALRDKVRHMPTAHDMDSVRESIARGRQAEWRERFGEPGPSVSMPDGFGE